METKYLGYRFLSVKITALVVFGFGSQAFVWGFSKQNINSVNVYYQSSEIRTAEW